MTLRAPEREQAVIDAMGEDSFPASDPPAVWTWDVEATPAAVDPPPPGRKERVPAGLLAA